MQLVRCQALNVTRGYGAIPGVWNCVTEVPSGTEVSGSIWKYLEAFDDIVRAFLIMALLNLLGIHHVDYLELRSDSFMHHNDDQGLDASDRPDRTGAKD